MGAGGAPGDGGVGAGCRAVWSLWSHAKKQGSVGGIMVSIAAFQAVDPGSIPGRRRTFIFHFGTGLLHVPLFRGQTFLQEQLALWRNGSASDSRSEGYVFKSHWGQRNTFSLLADFVCRGRDHKKMLSPALP